MVTLSSTGRGFNGSPSTAPLPALPQTLKSAPNSQTLALTLPPMASPSSSSPPPAPEKPVVVRVKRKASQARLDTLWLEIDERPAKRALLDFGRLSINDSEGKVQEEPKTKKLLVQHVETVNYSEATKEVLQSFLPDSVGSENTRKNIDERKIKQYKWSSLQKKIEERTVKQDKPNQDKLVARKKHEELVRSARFEQIWKSRRGSKGADDYSLREFCHLYDVVRVDTEEEKADKDHEAKDVSAEDNAILCNFLPLMREFLPTAAEEIESDMKSYLFKEDDYVYDLYTVEDKMQVCEEGDPAYPLVHLKVDDDDWYDGPQNSEYESDDSNAEDNPRNDYPEESTTEDEDDKDSNEDDDKSSGKDGGRDSSEDDGYYDYHIDSEEYEKEIDGDEVSGDEDMT